MQDSINNEPSHREGLLRKILELFDKSETFKNLPQDKLQALKNQYRKATADQLWAGIDLLMTDIKKTELARKKAEEGSLKNKEILDQIREMDQKERAIEQKMADNLLRELEEEEVVEVKPAWWQKVVVFFIKMVFIFGGAAAAVMAILHFQEELLAILHRIL
jgi:hypothetical protein